MFEDKEWTPLLKFPCILGFVLDSMHLVDGGVFKDLINNLILVIQLKFDGPFSECETLDPETIIRRSHKCPAIIEFLDKKLDWMNRFKFLETPRKMR